MHGCGFVVGPAGTWKGQPEMLVMSLISSAAVLGWDAALACW